MAWISTPAGGWTGSNKPEMITTGGGKTVGIIENSVIPSYFVNDVPMGWFRRLVTQTDDTTRTEYRGLTLAAAKALCAFIGDTITQANGRVTYTRATTYSRVNEADGFTVSVVEVASSYTVTDTAP